MARTRLDPEARREQLLEAAIALFSAEGPGVSMSRIARAADVSQALLFHYFPTKDALWIAAVTRAGSFAARVRAAVGELERAPVVEVLEEVAMAFARMDARERRMVALLLGAMLRDEPTGAFVREAHAEAARSLGAALSACGALREGVDPQAAALGFLGGLVLFGMVHGREPDEAWRERAAQHARAWVDAWSAGALAPEVEP